MKKKALITGASSGIGKEFAIQLANEYDVTLVARNEQNLKELKDNLDGDHRYMVADLSISDGVQKIENEILNKNYNLLINNAGYAIYEPFVDVPLHVHENILALNINALMRLSYIFLKNAKQGNALINVSSALSRVTFPGGASYAGSKGFVTVFTESLWYEFKDKGIYVMALLPGATKTNFHKVAIKNESKSPAAARMAYTPDVVVKEAIEALKNRKKASLISGPRYRRMIGIMNKIVKREKMITIMGQRSPGLN